jgi:hypothetical protein
MTATRLRRNRRKIDDAAAVARTHARQNALRKQEGGNGLEQVKAVSESLSVK